MRATQTRRLGHFAGIVATAAIGQAALGQFSSDGVSLHVFMDFADLGGGSSGNDCWGYVSGSGREYALMGVNNKMVVVEITDPDNPVVIGNVPHSNSTWGDIKTYGTYCYVVTDQTGNGIDVVNLADIDSGVIDHVQNVTDGGLSTSHNVAIDTTSGFLYLAGANLNGGRLMAYTLANPADPTFVGQVSSSQGTYVHDAEIVTYTSGPLAGMQLAYCANGGTGLDIYDVTDKGNMVRLSRTTYGNLSYAHQIWVDEENQLAYLNDELDGINETVIFDVSDPNDPQVVNTYGTGVPASDHNLYLRDGFIFEAEYRAGLRVMCAEDPTNPTLVGFFDTYPGSDANGFDGAWSVYPFFPSGTVIVSDISSGMFILDPTDALTTGVLGMEIVGGAPQFVAPAGASFQVQITEQCGATLNGASPLLHYDDGGGFDTVPLSDAGGGLYDVEFPALPCGSTVQYYVSAQTATGTLFTSPAGAPGSTHGAIVAAGLTELVNEDFEIDTGWTAENLGAITGDWERAVPIDDDGWAYDPAGDSDGSGQAWVTDNGIGNTDIDNGAVRLVSPTLDLTDGPVSVGYDYFLNLTEPGPDVLLVEMSDNGDAGPWVQVALHDTSGGLSWRHHEMIQSELEAAGLVMTANMKIRFTANDADPQSINEAGLDAFTITKLLCAVGDLDGDGMVGTSDLLELLASWGPCGDCGNCPADLDGDCSVGTSDLLMLLANWG